jgi:hypothetical protein
MEIHAKKTHLRAFNRDGFHHWLSNYKARMVSKDSHDQDHDGQQECYPDGPEPDLPGVSSRRRVECL